MRQKHHVILLLAVVALHALTAGCDNDFGILGDRPAGAALPVLTRAKALSNHYVEVIFSGPASDVAELPSTYVITGPDERQLQVVDARLDEGRTKAVLTTAQQEEVEYLVDVQSGATREATESTAGSSAVTFMGSDTREPFLESAISLSNTSLLLTFSEPMDPYTVGDIQFYRIADPDGDTDVDIKIEDVGYKAGSPDGDHVEAIHISEVTAGDDRTTVVLTTTPQDNIEYTIKVTNVKSKLTCEDGETALLDDTAQGGVCAARVRPLTTDATPASHHITARTKIDHNGQFDPDASGIDGTVSMSVDGAGVKTAGCAGSACISGQGGDRDEELIFTFDYPERADTIVVGLQGVDFTVDDPVIFASSVGMPGFDHTIQEAEIDAALASTGPGSGDVYLALTPVPDDSMIDAVKVRETADHVCVSSVCLTDGRSIDPTRNTVTFFGIPPVDTIAPQVVNAAAASATSVLVSFSEPLNTDADDPLNFTITPDLVVTDAIRTRHATQILLTTLGQIPDRLYTVTVSNVADKAGNAIDPNANSATFRGTSRELALLSAIALSNTSVLLTFSEPMDPTTAENTSYYRIDDPDGDVDVDIVITGAVADPDNRTVVLTTSPQKNIEYTMRAANLRARADDFLIDPARSSATFFGIAVDDEVPPTVTGAAAGSDTSVLVSFSEPLDNEADDPLNFSIDPPLVVTDAVQTRHQTQMLLSTLTQVPDRLYTVTVMNVKDKARNTIVANDETNTAQFRGSSRALFLHSAVSLSNTQVLVTFSEPMDPATTECVSVEDCRGVYSIADPDGDSDVDIVVQSATPDLGERTVVLNTTPQKNMQYALTVTNVKAVSDDFLIDPTRNTASFFGIPTDDDVPPTVTGAAATGSTSVLVSFSEPLDNEADDPLNFSIDPPLVITDAVQTRHQTQMLLTTLTQAADSLYTVTVSSVKDKAGNVIDPDESWATFRGTSRELYLLSAISLSNTSVLLTFNEPVNATTAQNESFYRIDDTDGDTDVDIVITSAVVDPYDRTVVLTTSPQENIQYTVRVTNIRARSDNFLVDPARSLATFLGIPPVDTTPPRVVDAVATGATSVLVSFNEPLGDTGLLGEPLDGEPDDPSNYRITVASCTAEHCDGSDADFEGLPCDSNNDCGTGTCLIATSDDCSELVIESGRLTVHDTQVLLTTLPQVVNLRYVVTVANIRDKAGNEMMPPATATFLGLPPRTSGPARVVGAISTSNRTVVVTFNKSMGSGAEEADNYSIVQETLDREIRLLGVFSASFLGQDRTTVELITAPQNEVTYTVTVVNVKDATGNQLTPGGFVATFAGTPFACQAQLLRCNNGHVGLDGSGLCNTDDDCDDDAPCDPAEADCENTCVPSRTCAAGRPGQDGQGGCETDDDCDDDPPCTASEPDCDGFCNAGCHVPDTDGDGLPDTEELEGWTVVVTLADGTITTWEVTSSAFAADGDGDGLDDREEQRHGTDPRDTDTDADLLTDSDELRVFFSSPTKQDTDGDGLTDSSETRFFKSSPIHADTDGDGFNDRREVFDLYRNPRIADLPVPRINIGDMRLQIDERYTYVDQEGQTVSEETSSSTTLAQSRETAFSKSDTLATKAVLELGTKFGTEVEVSMDPKATFNMEAEVKSTLSVEHTSTVSQSSVETAQQVFENSYARAKEISKTQTVTREVFGAAIDTNITIENASDIAFTISNIELSVLEQGRDRTRFVPVATLLPSSTLITGQPAVFNIGPADAPRGPIIFSSRDVFPNLVEDLLRSPRGLLFKLANFDITDEFGRNLAFTSQEAHDRTALLTVDKGDGHPPEKYLVTTNASFDDKLFMGGTCDENSGNPGDTCYADTDCHGRCSEASANPGAACSDESECPNGACIFAGLCEGAYLGGFDEFGIPLGLPMDYVLQDILRLEKNPLEPNAIVAGPNGIVQTVAVGDDQQVIPIGLSGFTDREIIILAGENGVLDTEPNNSDLQGDDAEAKTTGYETSLTCNATTKPSIHEPQNGGDGIASTRAQGDDVQEVLLARCLAGENQNEGCDGDEDCPESTCQDTFTCILGDDQGRPCGDDDECDSGFCFYDYLLPGQVIVSAGPNGFLETVASGDDEYRGPGEPCSDDDDCPDPEPDPENPEIQGLCDGREVLVRFKNAQTGDPNRYWLALTTDEIPVGSNFGEFLLKPQEAIALTFGQDIDRDRLFAREEFMHGSSDRDKDTDDDGLDDYAEIRTGWIVQVVGRPELKVFPDPRLEDSDGDGLTDQEEKGMATDPRRRDTDNDGLSDLEELDICNNADPPECCDPCDPCNPDSDGDSLTDGREILDLDSDPLVADAEEYIDSDVDGLTDADEIDGWDVEVTLCNNRCPSAFNGTCDDSPGDACAEPPYGRGSDCYDCGPRTQTNKFYPDLLNGDSDFDGLPDLVEKTIGSNPEAVDTDGDGLLDFDEFADFGAFMALNYLYPGFFLSDAGSQQIGTDPASQDSDGDRLSDDFERLEGWRVLALGDEVAREVFSDPQYTDTDLDGATDLDEFLGNDDTPYTQDETDPTDPDTDGDGRLDSEEVGDPHGSDPLVPDVFVSIVVDKLIDVDGPFDGTNNANEWEFGITARLPGQDEKTLLNPKILVDSGAWLGTLDCEDTRWITEDIISADLVVPAQTLALSPTDPIIIEIWWAERDGDCDSIEGSCHQFVEDIIEAGALFSTRYIPREINIEDGECSLTIRIVLEVD